MASWNLPLSETKEIVETIARRVGLDDALRNKLWYYIERMPEALRSAWVNSFGDVSRPGLSVVREQALARRFMHENPDIDDKTAARMAHKLVSNSPDSDHIYGDVIIRHPEIITDDLSPYGGYVELGHGNKMMLSTDPAYSYYLPHAIIHEGAHYMDKARGAAKNVRNNNLLNEPRYESADWLPNESFKLPTTAYDVEQALVGVRPESYKRFVAKKFAPIRSMGVLNYKHTDPTDIESFARTPLREDAHGVEYFVKSNTDGHPEMNVPSVSTEGLAQWLEFLPTYEGLTKLPITKKIIERIEDDPRRGFDIDFNKFMEE